MFCSRYDHQTKEKPPLRGGFSLVWSAGCSVSRSDNAGPAPLHARRSEQINPVPLSRQGRCPCHHTYGVYAFDGPQRSGMNLSVTGSNQAYRAISTGQLNMLPCLHLRPIDVVVFHGPQGYLVLRGASRLDAFSGYPVRS